MRTIHYLGSDYTCHERESVLSALLRQGVALPFSCRKGSCAVCMQRCVTGTISVESQKRIDPRLSRLGYFLPCICYPEGDLTIEPPRQEDLYVRARIAEKRRLAADVCRLLLEPTLELRYRPGQFVRLRRPDGLVRSYSLASVYGEDYFLELHVKRVPNGEMSRWLHDAVDVDDEVDLQGPRGTNHFQPADDEQSLVLLGTGTGIAPLYGIARDAVGRGHRGPIHLYYLADDHDSLYLQDELSALQERASNLTYRLVVPDDRTAPPTPDVAFDEVDGIERAEIHLAGSPDMIERAMALVAELRIDRDAVFADAFFEHREVGPRELPPDRELWSALEEGKLLKSILTEFYDIVFEDEWLNPYFEGVTKGRVIEKVYSFLRQIFTGERLYFGDRPRNAHHWMVIDDSLFDHRERLLGECMRRHGLPEHLIVRWRKIEERFRRDIVKSTPWKRIVDGVELPVDGFGKETLLVSTLCDGCEAEVAAGENVKYHLRLGKVFCADCSAG